MGLVLADGEMTPLAPQLPALAETRTPGVWSCNGVVLGRLQIQKEKHPKSPLTFEGMEQDLLQ